MLRTPSGRVELAPAPIVDDLERLMANLSGTRSECVLIGRRDVRSNNSWMHNLPMLVRGKPRCTLHVHPRDAEQWELTNGELACLTSSTGTVVVPVEVTDAVMPGVVSLPHGWGHDRAGSSMTTAAEHAGVNVNRVIDSTRIDPLSMTAALNGTPVMVRPLAKP